jgi:hypothetical protein
MEKIVDFVFFIFMAIYSGINVTTLCCKSIFTTVRKHFVFWYAINRAIAYGLFIEKEITYKSFSEKVNEVIE